MSQVIRIVDAYHGTPFEIHASDRPFLDPRRTVLNGDEGDPEIPHVFATSDLTRARLYGFKNPYACGMHWTASGFVLTYNDVPPDVDAAGFVYKLPAEGFEETRLNDGRGTKKLVITEENMPWVRDADGGMVRGIPVGEPFERVTIRDLVGELGLRIFFLADDIDKVAFCTLSIEAKRANTDFDETTFMIDMASRNWIRDITGQLLNGIVEVNFKIGNSTMIGRTIH